MNGVTDSPLPIGSGPLLAGKSTLHHIGFVVASISDIAGEFAKSVSATWDSQVIHDPLQRVQVAFFQPGDARNPVMELVEPADSASPVNTFLKKGGGLHHVCYEIEDLDTALTAARISGWVVVSSPKPAAAFGGRRIAWICSKNHLLLEFLERCKERG